MPRASTLWAIAALLCFYGGAPQGKDQATSADPGPAPIATTPVVPARPAPTAGGGSTAGVRPVSSPPRTNKYLRMAVTEAGFDPAGPSPPPGLRQYTVGLLGIGRSRGNVFVLEFQPFVFAQNDRGCISRPESNATWLKHPFGPTVEFSPAKPTEGELAFLVPEDTQRVRVLIASADGNGLVLPAGEDFTPAWPPPAYTIDDGGTLRVLVLPNPAPSAALPPPPAGREHVKLDFVIENLNETQGIEFQTSQQLRLVDPAGKFVQPSALTKKFGCRLDDGDLIPPGHARRFLVVYDMPAGAPKKLQYRGFEVDEVTVDLE